MNRFKGFNIKKIYIITKKYENAVFDFVNEQRQWDGFVLITSGEGYCVNQKGEKYSLECGDMLLLRKGDRYKTHLPAGSSYITSAFDFAFDKGIDFPIPMPFVIKCNKKQINDILKVCEIWQSHSWDSCTTCRIMIMDLYLDILKKQVNSSETDKDILKALSYIHANFKNNFSSENLANYCSISLSYLRAKFLKQTGTTITKYRNSLRISAAKEMLNSDCFSVTEIAQEIGCCDVYHFSKLFKKETGLSPSDYVTRHKN